MYLFDSNMKMAILAGLLDILVQLTHLLVNGNICSANHEVAIPVGAEM